VPEGLELWVHARWSCIPPRLPVRFAQRGDPGCTQTLPLEPQWSKQNAARVRVDAATVKMLKPMN